MAEMYKPKRVREFEKVVRTALTTRVQDLGERIDNTMRVEHEDPINTEVLHILRERYQLSLDTLAWWITKGQT